MSALSVGAKTSAGSRWKRSCSSRKSFDSPVKPVEFPNPKNRDTSMPDPRANSANRSGEFSRRKTPR
jgi:hypothetical protein